MVVDTCVILDVLERDPVFGVASAEVIDQYAEGGLIISPLTYVELAPAFLGNETRERFSARHRNHMHIRGIEHREIVTLRPRSLHADQE